MSVTTQLLRPAAGLVAAVSLVACGGSSPSPAATASADVGSGALTGAGATFPEPFYTKAFYDYSQKHPQVTVNYQAVGSGAGIQQYTKGTVDFGASDVPMTASELTAAGGDSSLIEVPTTVGVVAIAYNLSSFTGTLKLDGTTLANIYLGTIKKWNDPAIAALNPGATLPSSNITVVHRSDGSGTSYGFTDYLSKVSPDWKSKVGTGKSVQWPAGIGGAGNQGVGQAVQQNDGAIGYVELAYVVQSNLKAAQLKNAAGNFVAPTLDGASAAAASNTNPNPNNFSITNDPGANAYPIASFSWLIIKRAQADPSKGKAIANLFQWLVTDGQADGKSLQYAPLPKVAQDYAIAQLKLITVNGTPVLK
jgi:phosphate transport system substrate-binding protein